MDFDTSKENIQPLRGGRNAAQLSAALQAQHNQEYHQEILQKKAELEHAIRTYNGNDPLEVYYQYISWVEQSYPKHGHEGNLNNLLKDCLSKFENVKTYANDRRFCKLWIKFIDLQENPIELYQMLYSKGICRGCADLYKAWAYYHEANGDFRSADVVFNTAKKECAQPFQDINTAHENMIYAAGQQVINGIDERRLSEQRQALTMLHAFKPGHVGSVRTGSTSNPGIVPSTVVHGNENASVQIYEDQINDAGMVAGVAPDSMFNVIKKDVVKENLMKPGTWTSSGMKKGASTSARKQPGFTFYDETNVAPEIRGIQLPTNFFSISHNDFSNWKCDITTPDPEDPTKIPMYCKKQVYIDPTTEYSIEEVRARRYVRKNRSRLSVPYMETEQAIQSISAEIVDTSMQELHGMSYELAQNTIFGENLAEQENVQANLGASSYQQLQEIQQLSYMPEPHSTSKSGTRKDSQFLQPHDLIQMQHQSPAYNASNQSLQNVFENSNSQLHSSTQVVHISPHHKYDYSSPIVTQAQTSQMKPWDMQSNLLHVSFENDMLGFSRLDNESQHEIVLLSPKAPISQFELYEEPDASYQKEDQRGTAMRTPFNQLTDEDLAETGSRGGLDIATTAQATDGAKRLAMFDDDDDSSSGYGPASVMDVHTTNTEIFSLNAMHVSTPQNKQVPPIAVDAGTSKKQLFAEPVALSVILEEKSSEEGSFGQKSAQSHMRPTTDVAIETENNYHFNLSENMKENAGLRSSILYNIMECDTQPSTPTSEEVVYVDDGDDDIVEHYETEEEYNNMVEEHIPYAQLQSAPTDPFKPAVIERLLQHVGFPGRHKDAYVKSNSVLRLAVRKDTCHVGRDRFIVEKMLGKGTFGSVFKAINQATGEAVALKQQKPPNKWEFYICKELQKRLANHPLKKCFMNVHRGYYHECSSILLSDFCPYGSLLDVANTMRTKLGRSMKETLCIYFTIEMLNIVQTMHEAKIIHADIKPDNFLVTIDNNNTVGLQLIDFGCSIDMSLYPEGSSFIRRVTTEDFVCCEMLDQRPWHYHTDLFCVAASTHVLLFDKYIQLKKKDDCWSISQKINRYWHIDMWNYFFATLLNMQKGLPDVESLKVFLKDYLASDLQKELRELVNTIKKR